MYLTVKEVAERLRVSHDAITRLINRGRLPASRLSGKTLRISEADLDAFMDAAKR